MEAKGRLRTRLLVVRECCVTVCSLSLTTVSCHEEGDAIRKTQKAGVELAAMIHEEYSEFKRLERGVGWRE